MGKRRERKDTVTAYAFAAPQLLGLLILVFAGVVFTVMLSFSSWNFYRGFSLENFKWIGLTNYKYILSNYRFHMSLLTNGFMMLMVPATAFCALALGNLINQKYIFQRGLRALFFVPNICNMVAVIMLWSALFHPRLSPVSELIRAMGIEPPQWFTTPWNARFLIYFLNLWRGLGYYAFIYLGALLAIPKDLYEAADVMGASKLTQFFKITVPLVSPTTFFVIITGLMNAIKDWVGVMLLTNGSPGGATTVLGMLSYRFVFSDAGTERDLGAASAVAVIMLLIAAGITIINWTNQSKWVNYTA